MKVLKCYIAGKLNDNAVGYINNLHNMMMTAEMVRKAGLSVYVPCLDLLMGMVHGGYDYGDYFNNSQPWLESSDCLFLVPGWETSDGTRKEIQLATELSIPIFSNLDTLKTWISEQWEN